MGDLSGTAVVLFVLAVFPGLVSTAVYRLIMPARPADWGNAVVQGLFYSTVNFVLWLPVLYPLVFGYEPLAHPVRYILATILVFLVGPVLWPILLAALFRSRRVARRIQIPYPSAWDFLFDRREPAFVLVHLGDGSLLGGYWGGSSYAGSFPNDGDIYLEAVYTVDEQGHFRAPIPNTRGVLLRKDQYSYIELFAVPGDEEPSDAEEEQQQ